MIGPLYSDLLAPALVASKLLFTFVEVLVQSS